MDIIQDKSRRVLIKIAEKHSLPDYVKKASAFTIKEAEKYSDNLFADPHNREYPIDGKANTWLSAAYYHESKDVTKSAALNNNIYDTIKIAAEAYGVLADVLRLEKDIVKKAAAIAETECAFVDNNGVHHYPIDCADDVKLASIHFANNRYKLDSEHRSLTGKFIMKKAEQYNVPVEQHVHREAGYALPDIPKLEAEINFRIDLTKDAETKELLNGIKGLIPVMDCSENELDKVASMLTELDKLNGLDQEYGKRLSTPADAIYGWSIKQAEEYVNDTLVVDKKAFSLNKLAALDISFYKETLDPELFSAITTDGEVDAEKLASIVPTLPLPEKMNLEESLVNVCG